MPNYARIKVSVQLFRRLSAAGLDMDKPLDAPMMARSLILRWLVDQPAVPEVEETGSHDLRIPLPDAKDVELRVAAAKFKVSHGVLAHRILHATCPHLVEALSSALEKS